MALATNPNEGQLPPQCGQIQAILRPANTAVIREYPIPADSRPSISVEASAWHLIRHGWLADVRLVRDDDGSNLFCPSETITDIYKVRWDRPTDTIACECKASESRNHCKHITILQIVMGFCRDWSPEPPVRPGARILDRGAGVVREAEAVAAAASIPEPAGRLRPAQRPDFTPQCFDTVTVFGNSELGITNAAWNDLVAHIAANNQRRGDRWVTDQAIKTVVNLSLRTMELGGLNCSVCAQQLAPIGNKGTHVTCPQCGFIHPKPTRKEARAAA